LLRDLSVALVESRGPRRERQFMGQISLPLLEAAIQSAPADARAQLAMARALRLSSRGSEALTVLQALLEAAPAYEDAVQEAASLADVLGQSGKAVAYWQQALALDPASPDCHLGLAKVFAGKKEWHQGIQESRAVLQVVPEHLEARMILVQCLMQSGQADQARREIAILLASDTAHKEALRRLLSQLPLSPQ
jgi:tetratricopeptide (TPR) repeat protein